MLPKFTFFFFRWYHGRLDRYTAEERLWQAAKTGSYLIRESDRKPGSYVLSYLGRTGINHFRITAVCGDFYIGKEKHINKEKPITKSNTVTFFSV